MAELLTLDKETFRPPESRIADAASAREIVTRYKEAEQLRASRRAKVQGLLDGNRPVPQGTLAAKGRGGESNVNWRSGEGTVDAAKTPYFDIVMEAERYADIYIEYGDDPSLAHDWSNKASNRWKKFLDGWDAFDFNTQLLDWHMCVHGVGHAMWENNRSPLWKARKIGDVLVSDDAEANIDELETAVIPRSYLPGKLYEQIKNEGAAKTAGWDVDAVRRAIVNAANEATQRAFGQNWELYQNAIRNGDASWNHRSKRIFVVDVLQKEFDGKVSHYILLDDGSLGDAPNAEGKGEEFLFKKVGRFESFAQVLCPFFFDIPHSGEWHGIKGLGPKIFDFCEVENRLTNKLINGAIVGSGLVLQAQDANALQQSQLVEFGGGAMAVGPGLTVQQTRLAEQLQGPLAVKRDLQGTLQSNTGQYRERVSGENLEPTLGQAQLNAVHQTRLGKTAINRHCKSLDRMYREMVRRALNLAEGLWKKFEKLKEDEKAAFRDRLQLAEKLSLDFYEGCIKDGIPEEALKFEYVCSVKAARPVGYGSAQMRMMLGDKALTAIAMMDERGRNDALRFWATNYFGPEVADRWFPRYDTPQIADEHAALATLENNALRTGGDVLVTPTQNHVVHFKVHFGEAQEQVMTLRAGQANPAQVLMLLHTVGPHLGQHLQRLQGDETRKAQFGELQQAWLMLSKITDQLQQQIEEAMRSQEQNPPEPQVDPKLAAALLNVRLANEIKREKMMGDFQLRKEKQDFQMRLKDYGQAFDMRLKGRSAQLEMLNAPPAAPAEVAA